MSSPRRVPDRRGLAWTAAIAVPILAGAAILVPMAANGAVDLPDKTPQELIEFADASQVDALSGTIEQTSDLGLPDLGSLGGSMGADPGAGDQATAPGIDDLISLVTGTHTAKVYLDGQSARMQVLDPLAERNVYIDGAADQAWYVDSETQSATRLILPSDAELEQLRSDAQKNAPAPDAGETLPTPEQMLDQALSGLDDSTDVTVGNDSSVAGRDVYELILTPRTTDTLVGEMRFAIDGETGTALAASVTPRGAGEPAWQMTYTQGDFSAPDPSVFAFTPGADVTVTEETLALPTADGRAKDENGQVKDAGTPTVIGEGWSSVVEMAAPAADGSDASTGMDADQLAMLENITTAVDGGRALQTSLFSVLITDDGRVLVGAVPTSRLVEAAQSGR